MEDIQYIDLRVKRGDSKSYTLTFLDGEENAVDITDWKIYFTVKEKITDTDDNAKIKKDVTSHTSPTAGKTQISLLSTDTSITPGNYIYDIQLKTDTGEVKTVMEGNFVIMKDVSQRSN